MDKEKVYKIYADDLKEAVLRDNITRLVIYGNDGSKVTYERKAEDNK